MAKTSWLLNEPKLNIEEFSDVLQYPLKVHVSARGPFLDQCKINFLREDKMEWIEYSLNDIADALKEMP